MLTHSQKQQGQLKQLMEQNSSQQNQQAMQVHLQLQQMSMKCQQDSNVVEQLKAIAAQKEAQVKVLEMELQNLRGNVMNTRVSGGSAPTYLSSPEQSIGHDDSGDLEVTATVDSRPMTSQSDGNTLTSRSHNASQSAMSMTQLSSRPTTRTMPADGLQSSNHSNQRDLAEIHYKCQEVEIMCRATEVERDKLSELVQVLQGRLAEETQKLNEANSQVQALKRATVDLEKRLGKQKLDSTFLFYLYL
ncbi:coiled-coil domain-containing protein 13 [Plakobranchus ocellatus]|uniref:Coiled-coil domain-containing protein 13 n=1 Tax=Plakobranchus ocellatus TaxID=259542 RepID=A0AAV3YCG4_9GAST|nr:coiled-coil domain-containing protein 13 [Plakobranchus ocellatus]